jgi:uncharacterized protein (TIGR02246 family)
MKQRASIALLMLAFATAGCARTANQPDTAAVAAKTDQSEAANSEQAAAGVKKMLDEYTAAWKASDAERIGKLYTDDAMILLVNHPTIVGRAATAKDSQDFFDKFTPVAFECPSQEMKFAGDWGFARGIYKDTYVAKAGGKSVSDQGKYIIIVQRQPDGSWLMSRDIHDSDGPSAAATN